MLIALVQNLWQIENRFQQAISGSVSPSICAILKCEEQFWCEELVLPWVSCNQVYIQKCNGTGGIWSHPKIHFLRTITRQVTNAMRKLVTLQSSDAVDARWEPLSGVPKVSFLNRNAFLSAKWKTRGHGENNYTEVWRCTREILELGGGRGNLQWILSVCGYTFYRINIHAVGV